MYKMETKNFEFCTQAGVQMPELPRIAGAINPLSAEATARRGLLLRWHSCLFPSEQICRKWRTSGECLPKQFLCERSDFARWVHYFRWVVAECKKLSSARIGKMIQRPSKPFGNSLKRREVYPVLTEILCTIAERWKRAFMNGPTLFKMTFPHLQSVLIVGKTSRRKLEVCSQWWYW